MKIFNNNNKKYPIFEEIVKKYPIGTMGTYMGRIVTVCDHHPKRYTYKRGSFVKEKIPGISITWWNDIGDLRKDQLNVNELKNFKSIHSNENEI